MRTKNRKISLKFQGKPALESNFPQRSIGIRTTPQTTSNNLKQPQTTSNNLKATSKPPNSQQTQKHQGHFSSNRPLPILPGASWRHSATLILATTSGAMFCACSLGSEDTRQWADFVVSWVKENQKEGHPLNRGSTSLTRAQMLNWAETIKKADSIGPHWAMDCFEMALMVWASALHHPFAPFLMPAMGPLVPSSKPFITPRRRKAWLGFPCSPPCLCLTVCKWAAINACGSWAKNSWAETHLFGRSLT